MIGLEPLDEPGETHDSSRWIPHFEVGATGVGPPITPHSGDFYPIGAADPPDEVDTVRACGELNA